MAIYKTQNVTETEKIGFLLGKTVKDGTVVAMFGDLGAGKTAFTRGFAKGMGIDSDVSSPTFAIVNVYNGSPKLCHFDMYRIDGWDDLCTTGFFEYFLIVFNPSVVYAIHCVVGTGMLACLPSAV